MYAVYLYTLAKIASKVTSKGERK